MNMQTDITSARIAMANQTKVAIARLMADGRWRTCEDMRHSFGWAKEEEVEIENALKSMVRAKLLDSEQPKHGSRSTYRRAEASLGGIKPEFAIIAALRKHQPISGTNLAGKIDGMSRSTVAAYLVKMEAAGSVRRVGHSQFTKWEVAE